MNIRPSWLIVYGSLLILAGGGGSATYEWPTGRRLDLSNLRRLDKSGLAMVGEHEGTVQEHEGTVQEHEGTVQEHEATVERQI
ncbi:MAG: hypothetical protein H6662_17840 [Ardenticatenaceae bacterium]|nr:hypothetical protein [Ardenticatenaceae bacterium]MCB8991394.1 hypothetical protein [Ardenticatenaceae bacterium]MCB9003824.1 hypothetical protein [Ardenticatenaceae bacterium]